MSELRDKLWPAFLAETGEQLGALELALLRSEGPADVNALFRWFHTIKSSCAMMGFGNMERLTHAAEDLLDAARRGTLALDGGTVDLLLRVVDALRRQLGTASATHADPPAEDVLVRALRDAAATGAMSVPAGAVDKPPAAAGMFAATVKGALPFACLLNAKGAPARKRAAALTAIVDAATASGFGGIARLAQRLQSMPGEAEAERLRSLADLMARLRYCESTTGTDCGTGATADALASAHWREFETALDAAVAEMEALARQFDAVARLSKESVAGALAVLERPAWWAQLFALEHSVALLRFVRQLLRGLLRDGVNANASLLQVSCAAVALPTSLAGSRREDPQYAAMCERALAELRHDLAGDGEEPSQHAAVIASHIAIDEEMLRQVATGALQRLRAAVEARRCIAEIEADLETSRPAGEQFANWLRENAEVLASRTVFQRAHGRQAESTRLRFLAIFDTDIAAVRTALDTLDPGGGLLQLQPCTYRDEAVATTATQPPDASEPAPPVIATDTLRIDSAALDAVVSRLGEMVMLRNMLSHSLYDERVGAALRRIRQLAAQSRDGVGLKRGELDQLLAACALLGDREERLAQSDLRLQATLSRLQDDVLDLRVVPIAMVFNRLPRVVRALAQARSRRLKLVIEGEQTRIDKGMVDVLAEPLLHLVRNAVDHGIESPDERRLGGKPEEGTLTVSARQQGNSLLVEVRDDGRGLEPERLRRRAIETGTITAASANGLSDRELQNLIFLPGFSTAESVTETSGRGVGMDAVKTRVTQLGGRLSVTSTVGLGTAFELRLPLSIAIQGVVLVDVAGRTLALPERSVAEVLSVPAATLQSVQGQAALLLRGAPLPAYGLAALLGNDVSPTAHGGDVEVVVLANGVHHIGVLVDRIIGRQEVFMREVHADLAALPGVGGASILGDGTVAVIIDTDRLFELALRRAHSLDLLLQAS